MEVSSLDHLVLTVRDVEATVTFYERALGMRGFSFAGDRRALAFGDQKINLHELGHEHLPNAAAATPGSADLCFLTPTPIELVVEHLEAEGVEVELGPVRADGARGELVSVYVRDPDGNLVEISNTA
jgi:catechol 2,3-dioxygenase-like lactoylglutathione lyase family enzyme